MEIYLAGLSFSKSFELPPQNKFQYFFVLPVVRLQLHLQALGFREIQCQMLWIKWQNPLNNLT